MPTTRKQAASNERRVHEEPPASPSVPTSANDMPRTIVGASTTDTEHVVARRGSKAPSSRSARSTASKLARTKRAELEAEEKLAAIKIKQVQLEHQKLQTEAELVRKQLEANIAAIREESDRDSVCTEEAGETTRRVSDWLDRVHIQNEDAAGHEANRRRSPSPPTRVTKEPNPKPVMTNHTQLRAESPTQHRSIDRRLDKLTYVCEKMVESRKTSTRRLQELPMFSGAIGDWLPFKAAMRESTRIYDYSPEENLQRLRFCLKGEARETVSALLFAATEPSQIMKTLEQSFGRPEVIIDNAIEDLKKLPKLGTTASELNTFAVKVQNIVTVINSLDERGHLHNPALIRIVSDKLSTHLKSKWCDYAEDYGSRDEPEIITLSRFLMREADRNIRHAYSTPTTSAAVARSGAIDSKPGRSHRVIEQKRGARVYSTNTKERNVEKVSCLCCGAEHKTTQCKKLKGMTVPERWEWAKETRICFVCLDNKHRRVFCKAKRCGIDECRQNHHALLHPPREPEINVVAASAHHTHSSDVLLKVCPIMIRKKDGSELQTYALLDEGSTITLVDKEIAGLVGASGPTRALNIHGVTSTQRETESQEVELLIRGQRQSQEYSIKARTVENLTLAGQSVKPESLKRAYLRQLSPIDVCYMNAKPRILIGADNWHLIVTRRLLSRRKSEPAASLTRLGWVLHGTSPRSVISESETVLHVHSYQQTVSDRDVTRERDDELYNIVKAHFNIEALGVALIQKPNPKEERATRIFTSTIKKIEERYEVGLPWASEEVILPASYDMAFRRLRNIERKMDASREFENAYIAQVEQLVQKGYAAKCDHSHTEGPRTWYLPHFAVTNPNKPGKVRMVFDAAARANGTCLNDVLLDGPDLLLSLQGVLFRFREKSVAITADIREMFLQVKIRKEDRAAQHFLWRGSDRSKPPAKYCMSSMIFGARSSPFLAHSVRNHNAGVYKTSHPLAHRAITCNHYMDDWVDSFDSQAEAARAIKEVQEVHRRAGFELAGWSTNCPSLLEDVPSEDAIQSPRELGANANPYGKTLGVLWLSRTDELAFNTARHRVPDDVKSEARTPTKREALSAVMSIFDPLGLLSPYTITAKIMLQGLWRVKTGWDEPLPPEEAAIYSEWQADLHYVDNLRIPRTYGLKMATCTKQLHVFCDASEQAFATVAYWRFQENEKIHVALIAGKARVAPMKAQSIPRMELQACLIGARLAAEIVKEHQVKPDKVVYWCDSKTVLHWIRNDSVRYTPYVAHRLGEIAELTEVEQWRWVPTAQNVADDATRSGNTRLKSGDRWFVGPSFLYVTEDRWPVEETIRQHQDEEVLVLHATEREPLIDMTRFSSYEKLTRTVAYVLAFIDKCRKRSNKMDLTRIKRAESILIRLSQNDSFPQEISRLMQKRNVDQGSRLSRLDPKYGEDGILRLNGRINAANIPSCTKEPPILDGKHPLVKLLIRNEHVTRNHIGRENVVNNLRQRFWILSVRPAVRKVLHECTRCKIARGTPTIPVKGNLPNARLSAYTRPFSRCGLDCFGPMNVTIGRRHEKRWGMIFTCLVTRAIHLETVASLSTDSAIMALRRMAARRGWPEIIWSDNATNFRGADVELKNAYQQWITVIPEYVLKYRTDWRYIDPGAPNQGGAWERLIRSVKTALAVTLKERAPREETLLTVLAEVEHTVNSRPLTHVAADPEADEALTPNHFLIGSAVGVPVVGECAIADKRVWRAAQAIANMFWARWIREYLPTLTPRGDRRSQDNRVDIGDVVVIADGLLPRNIWPKGRVVNIHTGPDGIVRSTDVQTRGGVFRRPVRRLIVLPSEGVGSEDLRRGEAVTDKEPSI